MNKHEKGLEGEIRVIGSGMQVLVWDSECLQQVLHAPSFPQHRLCEGLSVENLDDHGKKTDI